MSAPLKLYAVGVDHRGAPLRLVSRLTFGPPQARDWLEVAGLHGARESVLLSTCNRTEAYLATTPQVWPVLEAWLRADWARRAGLDATTADRFMWWRQGEEAVHHLFRVAAGLESLLIGEGEILAQVKEAYAIARAAHRVGPLLHGTFQAALRVGREVRRETLLAGHAVSPGAGVVALARQSLGSLAGRSLWVWGSGTMARRTAHHGAEAGARVTVTSPTLSHAQALAAEVGGTAVPWEERYRALVEADALVVAVRAPSWVLTREVAARARAGAPSRPLFLFDFGVPANVESAVGELDGIAFRGLEDLRPLVEEGEARRRAEAAKAARMVEEAAKAYAQAWRERRAVPLIRSLYARAEEIRAEELERTLRRLPSLDDRAREELSRLTHRIVRRLLNEPASNLRHTARQEEGETLLEAAASLFGLREELMDQAEEGGGDA